MDLPFESIAKIDINSRTSVSLLLLCHFCRGSCQLPSGRQRLPLQKMRAPILLQIPEQRRMRFLIGERFGALLAFFHDELV
jgi:hypothetical protein